MISHASMFAEAREMGNETPERWPIGEQNRVVIQAESTAARHGRRPRSLVKLDERGIIVMRSKNRRRSLASQHSQANDPFVIKDGSIQIRDLQPNRTKPQSGWELVAWRRLGERRAATARCRGAHGVRA
jgi:hypothetical protein